MGKFSERERTPGERYAARFVRLALADLGLKTYKQIEDDTGLAHGTLTTFFTGARWPRDKTLWDLDDAIGKYKGFIQELADNYGNAAQWVNDPEYRKKVADLIGDAIISRKYGYAEAGELASVPESDVRAIVHADPEVDYAVVTRLATALDLDLTQSNSRQDNGREVG